VSDILLRLPPSSVSLWHDCPCLGRVSVLFSAGDDCVGYHLTIQQHIQQGLKNKELSHSVHFLPVHGVVRSWRRRGLSGQAKTYSRAYAYLKKRSQWMRCRSYRRQHLPIVSGITEAACKVVFTQRLKCSGMAWTRDGGQVILDLRVIRLSGVWEDVHQRYLASIPMPVTQGDRAKGAQRGQQAA
jgi:hypothetical protein